MDRQQRKLSNFIVDSHFQVRYATFYTGLILVLHSIVTAIFIKVFLSVTSQGLPSDHLYVFVILAIGITYVGLILIGFTWGVVWSHRIAGPVYALKKHLTRLKQDDFSTRVYLRKTDYLRDLADELNLLTEHLEKKSKNLKNPK